MVQARAAIKYGSTETIGDYKVSKYAVLVSTVFFEESVKRTARNKQWTKQQTYDLNHTPCL